VSKSKDQVETNKPPHWKTRRLKDELAFERDYC